jgi:hypothetical protein
VVDRTMTLKRYHTICKYVTLVKTLRQRDILNYTGGPNLIP